MASKKLGNLIKEARTGAGLTQEQLARKISGLSATDISEAERGLKDLTQEQLKKIAKATGVTQASLLNAAKGSTKKSTSSKSTASKTDYEEMKKRNASRRKEERKIERAKVKIEELEAELEELDCELFGEAATNYLRAAEIDRRKAAIEEELLELYDLVM